MNILDAIILLIMLGCALVGFKKGFTKELVTFIGFFLVVIIAFILKNPISTMMYENLPFFSFYGLFKGVSVLNIILYEVIAFFIVVAVLTIVYRVLLFATSIFEKLLKATIILGIPSKILGMIVGVVEGIVWSFILAYIASLPLFNFKEINESKIKDTLLNKTPILSSFTKDFKDAIDEFADLKEQYEENGDTENFNYNTLEVLLKYNIVTKESIIKLRDKNKLNIKDMDKLIEKY